MEGYVKQFLCRVIAVCLIVSSLVVFTGCKRKKPVDKKVVLESDPYFETQKITLLEPEEEDAFFHFTTDCRLFKENFVTSYTINYPDAAKNERGLAVFDMEGNFLNKILVAENEVVEGFREGPDGEIDFLVSICVPDVSNDMGNTTYILNKYSLQGEKISSVNLDLGMGEVVNEVQVVEDRSILVLTYSKIFRLDEQGNCIWNKSFSGSGSEEIETMNRRLFNLDGKWYLFGYQIIDDYSYYPTIRQLDLETGDYIGKSSTFTKNQWNLFVNDGKCYSLTKNGVECIDFFQNSSEEVFNWNYADVDIVSMNTVEAFIVSPELYYFSEYVYGREDLNSPDGTITEKNWGHVSFLRLKKAEKNPYAGKEILSVGVYSTLNKTSMEYILKYNSDPEKTAHIYFHCYEETYEDDNSSETFAESLYQDLLSGTGPDILINFSDYSLFNSEDVLVDLNSFIDGEQGIRREDYFDNVFRSFEIKGKMYHIPICVDVAGFLGDKEIIGERTGWTFSEFNQIVGKIPSETMIMEKRRYRDILSELLTNSISEYIDYEKKEVYFDCEEFKQILEMTKKYGVSDEEFDAIKNNAENYTSVINKLEDGSIVLIDTCIYSLEQFAEYSALRNGNTVFVGFPSAEGSALSARPKETMGITASSKSKDLAWDFIKFFLGVDEQIKFAEELLSIPTSRQAFNKVNDNAIKKNKSDWEEIEANFLSSPDISVEEMMGYMPVRFSEKEAKAYQGFVENISAVYSSDPAIMRIINEESMYYFNGSRSVEDVCSSIQEKTTNIVKARS